ncbi:MAG: hypothetical protein ABI178_09520 [Rhodanobacter sp.]
MDLCQLQYDIADAGFSWWWPTLGLAAGLLGALVIALTSRARSARWRKVMVIAPLVFGVLWFLGIGFSTYSSYYKLKSRYLNGTFKSVEGKVVSFHAGNTDRGGAKDTFTVSGVSFSVTSSMGPGYRDMQASGSPLQNGVEVKIGYVDSKIVSLEICDK